MKKIGLQKQNELAKIGTGGEVPKDGELQEEKNRNYQSEKNNFSQKKGSNCKQGKWYRNRKLIERN